MHTTKDNNTIVIFSIAPADYTALTRILTFTPSNLTIDVPVPILNDDIVEGNETFCGLLDPQGQPAVTSPDEATVVITEDVNDSECYYEL